MQSPGAMWSASLPAGATTIYGVACSSNGGVSAAAGNASEGGVVGYYADKYNNGAMYWKDFTAHSPNSVSMDAGGQWVALADGHPDNTPGCFYLWSGMTGALQWTFPTSDMSWPIKIAANASLVVGGSDNGNVYAFDGPAAGGANAAT
jgi:WD40 repeat protein